MKNIVEAILNRNKDTIKDAMEEEFLRKFLPQITHELSKL